MDFNRVSKEGVRAADCANLVPIDLSCLLSWQQIVNASFASPSVCSLCDKSLALMECVSEKCLDVCFQYHRDRAIIQWQSHFGRALSFSLYLFTQRGKLGPVTWSLHNKTQIKLQKVLNKPVFSTAGQTCCQCGAKKWQSMVQQCNRGKLMLHQCEQRQLHPAFCV